MVQAPIILVTNTGSIRIDCGATEDYTDVETGVYYHTDQEFIDSGTNLQIASNATTTSVQLKDLRSFPEGTKNCYTLTPEKGKDNRYALQALFFYGDYDGKHQAPTFDLYIGINKWATINDDGSEDYDDWWDIILVLPTNYISVCLLNTGGGIPFISSLELRPVPYAIYDAGPSMALDVHRRYDAGHTTNKLVRFHSSAKSFFVSVFAAVLCNWAVLANVMRLWQSGIKVILMIDYGESCSMNIWTV